MVERLPSQKIRKRDESKRKKSKTKHLLQLFQNPKNPTPPQHDKLHDIQEKK